LISRISETLSFTASAIRFMLGSAISRMSRLLLSATLLRRMKVMPS